MHRQGIGKRYEFMIWARLLKEGFDVYPSLVDDKGIDGIVAFEGTYYEVQVKSARNWRDQRGIDLERLNKNLERIIVILNQTTDQIRYFTAADVLAEDSWAETVKWEPCPRSHYQRSCLTSILITAGMVYFAT